jgi:FkbM family methyltransferase
MTYPVHPFTVVESEYGRLIVNRHCDHHIDYLAKIGRSHIHAEVEALSAIARTLPAESVIVDAGANVGLVAVPLATAVQSTGGRVFAFEPQRPLFQAMCGSAVLNSLGNLFPVNGGLGDENGMMRVPDVDYTQPRDFGQVRLEAGEGIAVARLDSLVLPRLDLLKIDVEGMEAAVLRGAGTMLARFRPWAWVEWHMSDVDVLKSFFEGLDYEMFRVDSLNMLFAPRDKLAVSGISVQS